MKPYGHLRFPYGGIGGLGQQGLAPVTYPSDYPPTSGAIEVWNWGQATGNYNGEVTNDLYVASTTNAAISYGVTGPPDTNMDAIEWGNETGENSHHTAPGISSGQSSGAVDSTMQIGSSSFKFYFLLKSLPTQVDGFYYIMDYDLQDSASTFNEGYQIFVSTAGLFAPCSLVFISKDDNGDFPQFHAKTIGTRLYADNQWHLVEMVFNRSLALPTFKIDGANLAVQNTFGGPAVSAMGNIDPVAGIRFAQREYTESGTGRANMHMAAAVFSKDLGYTWS